MRAGHDPAGGGVIGIDVQIVGALYVCRERIAVGQDEAGHSVSQRRLADALRAADQPGVRNAPRAIGVEQRRLGLAMTKKVDGFPRMRNRYLRFGLAAHAETAAFPELVAKNRSRKADQMLAATFA